MQINADFAQRAVVHAASLPWIPSPMKGVERRMLDRVGEEVARATSIVRYAPGSQFSPHVHHGGEEFLVLDGVFQDEDGDFPVGSYVRNPPKSRHTPRSEAGCTIFVKLWQFDPSDRKHIHIAGFGAGLGQAVTGQGVSATELYRDDRETVRIEQWSPGAAVRARSDGGLEILCIDGSFTENGETFGAQSWLRLPDGMDLDASAGPDGCQVWLKAGHLRHAETN